jgi:hypothetical protein
MNDFNEYADLGQTGYTSTEPVKPEDEFFHSLYISGATRKNHINVEELAGKMQIRGVEYNLTDVNMIITHVKKILVKNEKDAQGKQKVGCFSFKKEPKPPWMGWNNRQCGSNSAERAANQFCNQCREQILLAGIYVTAEGKPIPHSETGKPIFIFLRGKGMKYNGVSQFLADCYKMEITNPLFTPTTTESLNFEKATVNNKRFVTNIGMGKADSAYGQKDVFTFKHGTPLDNQSIFNILGIAKKSLTQFNVKFDWTRTDAASGYTPDGTPSTQPVDNSNVIPESNVAQQQPQQQQPQTQEQQPQQTFNFEDINF